MRRVLVVLAAAAAAAVVVGVAGPSRDAHASPAAARPPVTVRMGEFFFRPKHVTVHVGQAVRFLDVGKIDHTVADTDAHWILRSRLIHPRPLAHGQAQVARFARPAPPTTSAPSTPL